MTINSYKSKCRIDTPKVLHMKTLDPVFTIPIATEINGSKEQVLLRSYYWRHSHTKTIYRGSQIKKPQHVTAPNLKMDPSRKIQYSYSYLTENLSKKLTSYLLLLVFLASLG